MGGRAGPGMIAGGCTKAPSHGPVAGADGTYVVADAEQVTLQDARGRERSRSGGSGFVIAPDGNQIAVYGRDALALVAPGQVTATRRPRWSRLLATAPSTPPASRRTARRSPT